MNLHAPDAMGQAAHQAAMFATKLDVDLLAAASPTASREVRADALARAIRKYLPLVRAFSELQNAAPNAFRQASNEDANITDFRERRTEGLPELPSGDHSSLRSVTAPERAR